MFGNNLWLILTRFLNQWLATISVINLCLAGGWGMGGVFIESDTPFFMRENF